MTQVQAAAKETVLDFEDACDRQYALMSLYPSSL